MLLIMLLIICAKENITDRRILLLLHWVNLTSLYICLCFMQFTTSIDERRYFDCFGFISFFNLISCFMWLILLFDNIKQTQKSQTPKLFNAIYLGFCVPSFVTITFIVITKAVLNIDRFDWIRFNSDRGRPEIYFANFYLAVLVLYGVVMLGSTGKYIYKNYWESNYREDTTGDKER